MIFIVWVAFTLLQQKTTLNLMNKYVKVKIFVLLDTTILEFNQYEKPDKAQFTIYGDLECLI